MPTWNAGSKYSRISRQLLSSRALPRWHSSTIIKIEEIPRELLEKPGPLLVPRDRLVRGKIHLPALERLARDLPARIPERRERFVLRIVHQDVTVGKIQNPRPSGLPRV